MTRYLPSAGIVLASALLIGAKACTPCEQAQAAATAICQAKGEASYECKKAQADAVKACTPAPPPTPPATCPDGLPPGPAGCPKTCADLACPYGCDEHPTGAVCRPKPPPAECLPGIPWCNDLVPPATCSTSTQPCKHNPSSDPLHCEMAPACPPTPPSCLHIECTAGEHCVDGRCVPNTPPANGTDCDGDVLVLEPKQFPASHGAAVNQAIVELTGCAIGSDCRLGDELIQDFYRRVVDRLRAKGLCAGQHVPKGVDEIAVATDQRAIREAYKVASGYDGPNPVPPTEAPRKVTWVPQAVRRAWLARDHTPPPAGDCPAAPCPARTWTVETLPDGWGQDEIGKATWEWRCHESGARWEDCTPAMRRDEPYCRSIGMSPKADGTLRADCPMRPDGHPEREAVERWLIGGAPAPDGPDCDPEGRPPFAVPRGSGLCRICEPGHVGDPSRVCSGRF